MSDRDELAAVAGYEIGYLCTHTGLPDDSIPNGCPDCWALGQNVADAILAAGYVKPRTINTVAELDALPGRAAILTEEGGIWASIKRYDGKNWWIPTGRVVVLPSDEINLPVTVLYEPSA